MGMYHICPEWKLSNMDRKWCFLYNVFLSFQSPWVGVEWQKYAFTDSSFWKISPTLPKLSLFPLPFTVFFYIMVFVVSISLSWSWMTKIRVYRLLISKISPTLPRSQLIISLAFEFCFFARHLLSFQFCWNGVVTELCVYRPSILKTLPTLPKSSLFCLAFDFFFVRHLLSFQSHWVGIEWQKTAFTDFSFWKISPTLPRSQLFPLPLSFFFCAPPCVVSILLKWGWKNFLCVYRPSIL